MWWIIAYQKHPLPPLVNRGRRLEVTKNTKTVARSCNEWGSEYF
jgi:hypothetical protein